MFVSIVAIAGSLDCVGIRFCSRNAVFGLFSHDASRCPK